MHFRKKSLNTFVLGGLVLFGALVACDAKNVNARKGKTSPADTDESTPSGYLSELEVPAGLGGTTSVDGASITVEPETSNIDLRITLRRFKSLDETGYSDSLNGANNGVFTVEVRDSSTNQIALNSDLKKAITIDHTIQTDLPTSEFLGGVITNPGSESPGYSVIPNNNLTFAPQATSKDFNVSAKVWHPDFTFFLAPGDKMSDVFKSGSTDKIEVDSNGQILTTTNTTTTTTANTSSLTDTIHVLECYASWGEGGTLSRYYQLAEGQSWVGESISRGSNRMYGCAAAMYLTSSGHPKVVTQESSGRRKLFDRTAGVWESDWLDSITYNGSDSIAAAFDSSSGKPVIYEHYNWTALSERKYESGSYSSSPITFFAAAGAQYLDTNPGPFFLKSGNDLVAVSGPGYVKSSGGQWPSSYDQATSYRDSNSNCVSTIRTTSAAVDKDGYVHMVYWCQSGSSQPYDLKVYYLTNRGGTWSRTLVNTVSYIVPIYDDPWIYNNIYNLDGFPSIAISPDNAVVIAQADATTTSGCGTETGAYRYGNFTKLKLSKKAFSATAFTHQSIDLQGVENYQCSTLYRSAAGFDSKGKLHVVVSQSGYGTYSSNGGTALNQRLRDYVIQNGTVEMQELRATYDPYSTSNIQLIVDSRPSTQN